MSDRRSTKELFREWRKGDAEAGQLMAQRFADWYYAIATSRLGEEDGRSPCENACARFGDGIVQVTEARQLVAWAYDIILDELKASGKARITDGDEPNAYTGNQRPKTLLAMARAALPTEMEILEAVYSRPTSEAEIDRLAEPLGGNPLGILKARYRVKQWLRDHRDVPFEVAPDDPVLDRAPLPLYESAKMASPDEEVNFEHWMLTDIDLCKDIAEFAHFAIALRGGVPDQVPVQEPSPVQVGAGSDEAVAQPSGNFMGLAAGGMAVATVVGGLLVLVVIGIAVVLLVF